MTDQNKTGTRGSPLLFIKSCLIKLIAQDSLV